MWNPCSVWQVLLRPAWALIAGFALFSAGCASLSTVGETTGRVVDGATNEPLVGVNVLAHWSVTYAPGLLAMHYEHADVYLTETVTDADGRFQIPGWGPVSLPAGVPASALLHGADAGLIFFKAGYESTASGSTPNDRDDARLRPWARSGQTIKLKKHGGTLTEREFALMGVLDSADYGGCNWQKIRQMVVAINREAESIKNDQRRAGQMASVVFSPKIAEIEAQASSNHCSGVKTLGEEIRQ